MTRLIHIAGYMRSGTTVLSQALADSSRSVAVGEASGIWAAWAIGRSCSCGSPVTECELWGQVFVNLQNRYGIGEQDAMNLQKLAYSVAHPRRVGRLMIAMRKSKLPGDISDYLEVTQGLYEALAEVSGGLPIVDSSKSPPLVPLLIGASRLDVQVVHIWRDARGVAYSEIRRTNASELPEHDVPGQRSLLQSVGYWSFMNWLVGIFGPACGKYVAVSYEEFTRCPVETLDDLRSQLGLIPCAADIPGEVRQHIAVGNPIRHRQEERSNISEDRRWERGLTRTQQVVVGLGTWPIREWLARRGQGAAR